MLILDGGLNSLPRVQTDLMQAKMFCRIIGGHLNADDAIMTKIVESINRCANLCVSNGLCLSANYQRSTKECSLNKATDEGDELSTGLSSDYIHITTRECAQL